MYNRYGTGIVKLIIYRTYEVKFLFFLTVNAFWNTKYKRKNVFSTASLTLNASVDADGN